MKRRILTSPLGILLFSAPATHAALVWDGSVDGISAFSEFNWTQNAGGAPGNNTINSNQVIANNATLTGGEIVISSGVGTPSAIGGPFLVGTNNLTISNGKLVAGGSTSGTDTTALLTAQGSILTVSNGGQIATNGIAHFNQIFVDGGIIDLRGTSGISFGAPTGANPLMSILNGSTVDVQFIAAEFAPDDVAVTLGGGSTLTFNGGGNPLNTLTLDILDTASLLRLTDETFGNFQTEHLSKVFYNGAGLDFGTDPFAIEAGDNALATSINGGLGVEIQAIPETSTAMIGCLGLPALFYRRRRSAN